MVLAERSRNQLAGDILLPSGPNTSYNIVRTSFDPGLGTRATSSRILQPNGDFNIIRKGRGYSIRDTYHYLVNISWTLFFFYLFSAFLLLNVFFALLYVSVGIDGISSTSHGSFFHEFRQAFFFSVQTCATVGYGYLAPVSNAANYIASSEILIGWIGFSVATGLFYGRFSRPRSSIIFSKSALIAPFRGGTSFQFRIVSRRPDVLVDVSVRPILVMNTGEKGEVKRSYFQLRLDLPSVVFMPLTWTLVHPIDEESPLHGKTKEQLEAAQAEIIIQVKAFDETYNQTIYSRFSYIPREIVWGAKYSPAFSLQEDGSIIVEVNKIDDFYLA